MKRIVLEMKYLVSFHQYENGMEYQIYYDVYYEWLKFMTHLGKMIAIGFNDL